MNIFYLRNRPHNWSLCRQHLTLYKLPERSSSQSHDPHHSPHFHHRPRHSHFCFHPHEPELLASPSTCTTSQYVSMSRKRPSSSYSCPFVVFAFENFSNFSLFVAVTALIFAIWWFQIHLSCVVVLTDHEVVIIVVDPISRAGSFAPPLLWAQACLRSSELCDQPVKWVPGQ